jgi:hypothetical protein
MRMADILGLGRLTQFGGAIPAKILNYLLHMMKIRVGCASSQFIYILETTVRSCDISFLYGFIVYPTLIPRYCLCC